MRLAASFNNFNPQADALEDRGEGFWFLEKRLPAGRHSYQFEIDGSLTICDPYAWEIEPGVNGAPPRAIVEVARPIYQWRHADWQRPNLRDLIIYEMHVGDFSPDGTFQGVTDRLDYLHSLGINCIELMPVYEAEEGDYWGYRPANLMAVRRSYGTMRDLLTLVDEAHGRRIAIVLDLVLAHTGKQCPLFAMYPYDQSPWYGQSLGETNRFGLPMLDYRKDPTNHFVRDVQNHWLSVYHVDGFRYDYLFGIGEDLGGKGLPYLMRTAREIRPDAYLIGECIPERTEMVNASEIGAVWHYRHKMAIEALACERKVGEYEFANFGRTVEVFDPPTQGYRDAAMMVNYSECHDETRLWTRLMQCGFDAQTVQRKAALAMAVLMTVPGEPLIYAGAEWGADNPYSQDPNKIHWELSDRQPNKEMLELSRELDAAAAVARVGSRR